MFMATQREQQILDLIIADPMISQQSIADRLQISRSAVAGHIMKLTGKGVIKGRAYVVDQAPFVVAIGGANIDVHGRPSRSLKRAVLPAISPRIFRDLASRPDSFRPSATIITAGW